MTLTGFYGPCDDESAIPEPSIFFMVPRKVSHVYSQADLDGNYYFHHQIGAESMNDGDYEPAGDKMGSPPAPTFAKVTRGYLRFTDGNLDKIQYWDSQSPTMMTYDSVSSSLQVSADGTLSLSFTHSGGSEAYQGVLAAQGKRAYLVPKIPGFQNALLGNNLLVLEKAAGAPPQNVLIGSYVFQAFGYDRIAVGGHVVFDAQGAFASGAAFNSSGDRFAVSKVEYSIASDDGSLIEWTFWRGGTADRYVGQVSADGGTIIGTSVKNGLSRPFLIYLTRTVAVPPAPWDVSGAQSKALAVVGGKVFVNGKQAFLLAYGGYHAFNRPYDYDGFLTELKLSHINASRQWVTPVPAGWFSDPAGSSQPVMWNAAAGAYEPVSEYWQRFHAFVSKAADKDMIVFVDVWDCDGGIQPDNPLHATRPGGFVDSPDDILQFPWQVKQITKIVAQKVKPHWNVIVTPANEPGHSADTALVNSFHEKFVAMWEDIDPGRAIVVSGNQSPVYWGNQTIPNPNVPHIDGVDYHGGSWVTEDAGGYGGGNHLGKLTERLVQISNQAPAKAIFIDTDGLHSLPSSPRARGNNFRLEKWARTVYQAHKNGVPGIAGFIHKDFEPSDLGGVDLGALDAFRRAWESVHGLPLTPYGDFTDNAYPIPNSKYGECVDAHVGPNGVVHLTWIAKTDVVYAQVVNGVASSPELVMSGADCWNRFGRPRVAAGPNGRPVVSWTTRDIDPAPGRQAALRVKVRTSAGWQWVFNLDEGTELGTSDVAVDGADGSIHVVYVQVGADAKVRWLKTHGPPYYSFHTSAILSASLFGNSAHPWIESDPTSGIHLAFLSSNKRRVAIMRWNGASWSAPTETPNSVPLPYVFQPSFTRHGSEALILAHHWKLMAGKGMVIGPFLSTSSSWTGPPGPWEPLTQNPVAPMEEAEHEPMPRCAFTANGKGVAAWSYARDPNIYTSYYSPDTGKWGKTKKLHRPNDSFAWKGQIEVVAVGNRVYLIYSGGGFTDVGATMSNKHREIWIAWKDFP